MAAPRRLVVTALNSNHLQPLLPRRPLATERLHAGCARRRRPGTISTITRRLHVAQRRRDLCARVRARPQYARAPRQRAPGTHPHRVLRLISRRSSPRSRTGGSSSARRPCRRGRSIACYASGRGLHRRRRANRVDGQPRAPRDAGELPREHGRRPERRCVHRRRDIGNIFTMLLRGRGHHCPHDGVGAAALPASPRRRRAWPRRPTRCSATTPVPADDDAVAECTYGDSVSCARRRGSSRSRRSCSSSRSTTPRSRESAHRRDQAHPADPPRVDRQRADARPLRPGSLAARSERVPGLRRAARASAPDAISRSWRRRPRSR